MSHKQLTGRASDYSMDAWDYMPLDSHIKIKRSTLIAFVLSIILHFTALFYVSHQLIGSENSVAQPIPKTLTIQLTQLPVKKSVRAVKKATSEAYIAPRHQPVHRKLPVPMPIHPVPIKSIPAPAVPAQNNTATDLLSYLNAKRQRTQDKADNAFFENMAANKTASSADEQTNATIRRNLQQRGASGIFEIRHMAFRTAQFSFRGWKHNDSNSHLELIDVDAPDNNIELAIVKKMIEIIRREYQGDFKWESRRLGRVLTLSARREDNAGLEDFLIQEFFSEHEQYDP